MRLLIGAVTEGLEFDGGTIYKEALGGSESAFVFMMRELAKLGHEVHAFTKCPEPGSYDGVGYHKIQEFNDLSAIFDWSLLLTYRHFGWLTRPNHARLRILVNHDILTPESSMPLMGSLWQADLLINLSEYHKKQYCDLLPALEPHIFVGKNGIDLLAIDEATQSVKKDKKRFVYGSRWERGLDVLLTKVWPRLYEADPERRLYIAGYGSKGVELPEEVKALYTYIDGLIEKTSGVIQGGQLKKDDWYKLLATSSAVLYPSAFPEISCHPAGTLVTTQKGVKSIEQVKAGDEVLTHLGRYRKVTKIMHRWHEGSIYKIRPARALQALCATGEHPILASQDSLSQSNGMRRPEGNLRYHWISAQDLRPGMTVLYPFSRIEKELSPLDLSKWCHPGKGDARAPLQRTAEEIRAVNGRHVLPRFVTIDPPLARLFGYFAAEGHAPNIKKRSKGTQLSFCFARHETKYIEDVRALFSHYFGIEGSVVDRGPSILIVYSSTLLSRMFYRLFYQGGKKRLPTFLMSAPERIQKQLLLGMWRGDGSVVGKRALYYTSSSTLAYQVQDLLLRLGYCPGGSVIQRKTWLPEFSVGVRASKGKFLGRRDTSEDAVAVARRDISLLSRVSEYGHEMPVRKVEQEPFSGWVYNLEVEEDNSYVANGIAVHNCINALEAQACGTPVICTDDFALPETIASEFCRVPGKHTSPEYQEKFIQKVEDLVSNDILYGNIQRKGRKHSEKYDWSLVAKSWEEKILSHFEERFQKNKHWVFRQLLFNSDVLAARELARQEAMPTELAEAEAILDRARTYKDEYAADDPEVLTQVSKDFTDLSRVPTVAPYLKGARTLLEIGCHYAEHSIGLSNLYPELKVRATDFSPACIEQAAIFRETVAKYPENISLRISGWEEALLPDEPRVDAVFAGEILEHVEDPYGFLDKIESYVKPGGVVILTVPAGPWEADSLRFPARFCSEENRFHISNFEFRDVGDMCSRKKGFTFSYCPNGITKRGELVGNWVMAYQADASPTGKIDLRRKFLTTRPYPGVSACLIVGNEEDNIRRCLKSIKDVVDEIIIVGTPACQDRTLEIAAEFTDRLFITTSDPPDRDPRIIQQTAEGDFGWWRNESIRPAQYPWILWVDADEILTGGQGMKKYLAGEIFNGFVVRQHHLTIDIPPGKLVPDVPIRLFRNFRGFYAVGCLHEHFQPSLNEPIDPAFQLEDVNIAHFGYITESQRREKCYQRNLKLLMKDRLVYPDRTLGLILLQRDYINFVSLGLEETRGEFDERIIHWLQGVCAIHRQKFQDPKDIYYKLSYALYQQALRWLGIAGVPVTGCLTPPFEVGLWLGGSVGGLSMDPGDGVSPSRKWFADVNEYREHLKDMQEKLAGILRLQEQD